MKAQQILNAVQEQQGIKTIGCVFNATKYAEGKQRVYTYKTWMDHVVGDFVVIETAKGYSVVEVHEVHETSQINGVTDIDYKWVVDKVDLTAYGLKLAKDRNSIKDIEDDLRRQKSVKITESISDDLLKRL